jgi:2-isopropylmalate synthase
MDHVIIFDTTLRDGEQAPGAAMTIADKLRIAHHLARLGVDVIEAGFPISSPAQADAVAQVVAAVQGPVIAALARATEADILAAAEALQGGTRTRIHTFIATSAIHLESKFGHPRFGKTLAEKQRTILRMAQEAVRLARTFTDDVEFSAEDAGRSDPGYLCEVLNAVVEAGATTLNIPDTTGYCVPDEYGALFRTIRQRCHLPDDIILSAHCHDDLGLAVANSLAAVQAGARQIECTINGIGERAGNAALEACVMALRVRTDRFQVATEITSPLLMEASRMVSVATSFPVPPNKAIVGKNAFSHEAGIHQDGVLKRRETYEIMRAEDVGQDADGIRLGRHSGRHGLFARLHRLGIPVPDAEQEALYARFVELADRKKEIFDEDLVHLMQEQPKPMTYFYRLEQMEVTLRTGQAAQAHVRVHCLKDHTVREASATGEGPVEAVYRAIDKAVGEAHDLMNYAIRSVTEGADALGEVSVLVGFSGACFAGKASDTDVIVASSHAYLHALNHLAAWRADQESVQFVRNGIIHAFHGGYA